MLSSLLSLVLVYQDSDISVETKSPVIIVGKDEAQIDLAPLFDIPVNEAIIFKKTNLKVHELIVEGRSVFVSELVAPLDGYAQTIKFLTELRASHDNIAYGSTTANYLSDFFKLVSPRKSYDAQPGQNCHALFASVGITDPSGQLQPIKGMPVGLKPPQDAPLRTRWSTREELQKDIQKNLAKSNIFPRMIMQVSYQVQPLTAKKLTDSESIENLKLSGTALSTISQQVAKLQQMSAALYDEILVALANELATGIPLDGKPTKLSALPTEIAAQIRRSIESQYELISEAELKRIQAFLDSDPALTFDVHIGAFEAFTNMNSDGSTGDRAGVAFVFGNPGGEKPRKNPPPY